MKPLHSLVTAALFFTSCASTPEEQRMNEKRKKRADRVAALANSAGAHFGLSPLERVMLERKARQIGWSKDPLKTGLEELDKHPKLEQKAWEWLQKNDASGVLDELSQQHPDLRDKANEWMRKNPRAAEKFRQLLK